MEWWMWLLLILVLLSLIVLIVWLLRPNARRSRRQAVISEASGEAKLPAEPTRTIAETQEEAAKAQEPLVEAAAIAEERPVEIAPDVEQAAEETAETVMARIQETVAVASLPDDLKIIEGIGPKISSVLQAAGITTLAQLAVAEVDELKRILDVANIRLGDPSTWPEQAALAAAAKWDELEALQDSLKGGRRV